MSEIKLMEVLTLLAIILGPIMAIQVDRWLKKRNLEIDRKNNIFKTLMTTRGAVLSYSHVEALNQIDLEFHDNVKYNNVITCWKEYFDNLSQKVDDANMPLWFDKNDELLANLLLEMGKSLGYNFDKLLIKRNIYSPVGHGKLERENQVIRESLIEVFQGKRNLPLEIISPEEQSNLRTLELQNLLIEYYQSKLKKSKV